MDNEQSPELYAQALFDQATTEWLKPLKEAAACFKPSDFEALDNPGLAFPKKLELLKRVLPTDTPVQVRNFLSLLASKQNMRFLPGIVAEFDRYAQRGSTRGLARVTSAVSLTDEEKRQLEAKLRGRYDPNMEFQYVVDPAILGGVIVRMGDKVIDGSVSGKLAALREKLK